MGAPHYRLGIDIGGTFTDLSLLDSRTGALVALKTPTVPKDPARGVANGIGLLMESGIDPAAIEYFVHGTTTPLNTIIQRSGARIALLVTEGFRDVLEIARLRLTSPWDFYGQRPAPLVPRELVVSVRERMRYGGTVVRPLEPAEIDRVIDELLALDVEGVAICLLHSYLNASHELALKARIAERAPHLFVSCSAEIWPQMREFERTIVTVMNAYVRPATERYLNRLEQTLSDFGVTVRPYLTRSNGGIMTTGAAKREAVQTLLSGPASGVIGALEVATKAGFCNVISFDMGGTSADIAVIEDGQVGYSREEHIGDFPVIVPAIGISSIGAGGGSIAWIDGAGVLKVGPRSAGADPGPACYGLGGQEPALSDAFLLCGYLNPDQFAGKSRLDPAAAEVAVLRVAQPLGLDARQGAEAIIRIALANMFAEFSAVLERKGLDPRDFTIVAFGGAGPVTACLLAEEVNIPRVLVCPSPGTLCALGALKANVMSDFIRTANWRLNDVQAGDLQCILGELERQAGGWLDQEAPPVAETELRWSADMRYVGQSYEIEVPVEQAWIKSGEFAHLAGAFHATHARVFSHADLEAPVEIVNLRVRAVGHLPQTATATYEAVAGGTPEPTGTRIINCKGALLKATVYHRESLATGHRLSGPAVVEQDDTTTIVPAGWQVQVDAQGNLIITLEVAQCARIR